MRITFSVDRDVLERARRRAAAMGAPLNQLLRAHLEKLAGDDEDKHDTEEPRAGCTKPSC